jgi:3-oxoacyl-[acyl-carrier-protein] synthase-1
MTGHSLGAAGVQEAIYCLLMMLNDFIAPNINVTELDEGAQGFDIVLKKRDAKLHTVMSNSFGFGGVNACLIFKKWDA